MPVVYTDRFVQHFAENGKLMLSIPLAEHGVTKIGRDKNGHRYALRDGVRVKLGPNPNVAADIPRAPIQATASKKQGPTAIIPKSPPKKLTAFLSQGKPIKIESSYISAAKFDPTNKILRLAFHNQPGVWHRYSDVTQDEAQSFFDASSKGTWLWDNLKGRNSKPGEHLKPHVKEMSNA